MDKTGRLDDNSPEMEKMIDKLVEYTDKVEEAKMTEGEHETLPAMTPAELDAFLNAEDEALKEDRGEIPVAEQLDEEDIRTTESAER